MTINHNNEAKLIYLDNDFEVIKSGNFVSCAVTKHEILLTELSYWNVERQEAYLNAEISFQRELSLRT